MATDARTMGFVENITFKDVVLDGFNQADEGEGFEYIVGEFKGGKIKVSDEPDESAFDSVVLDGPNGMNYVLCFEDENLLDKTE